MNQITSGLEVELVNSKPFGLVAKLNLPQGADAIIICANSGFGLKPLGLCLPHQLYLDKLEQIYESEGLGKSNFAEIVAIPTRTKDYIRVWVKGR